MARIGNVPKSQLYASGGFNTFHVPQQQFEETEVLDEETMADAAEAIRHADVEAQASLFDVSHLNRERLHQMNIDELRATAKLLNVQDREKITDQDTLIAAIERYF